MLTNLLNYLIRKRPESVSRAIQAQTRAVQATILTPDLLTVLTGPTIGTAIQNENRGNQFTSPNQATLEVSKRYNNEAQYGNTLTRECVNYRTLWIAGNGASISSYKAKSGPENTFVKRFLKRNKFESSLLIKGVRGGEIEGRALFYLRPVKEDGYINVECNFMRWTRWQYTPILDPKNANNIIGVKFKDSEGNNQQLDEKEIAYINLDNCGADISQPSSVIASVLTNIVNMDKALADWRSHNHFYGALGAMFEAKDIESAQMMIQVLEAAGEWQVGDTIAGPAKMYFPEPSGASVASFEKEITMNARIISGATGVPIHLLGWASEMSNRATADDLSGEAITSLTSEPREIWTDGLKEILSKAIIMHNTASGENINPDDIDVSIAQVSSQQVKDLVEVYLPLRDAGLLSDETVMAKIPGIDLKTEQKRLESQKEGNIERQSKMLEIMKGGDGEQLNEDEDAA